MKRLLTPSPALALLACAALALPGVAAAQTPRSVDAAAFDVAGVKLGMGREEAMRAIAQKLQLPATAVQLEKSPQLNPVTQTKEPEYFSVREQSYSVVVHFEPRMPLDKASPMRVSQVIYEQPWTPQNEAAMKASALDKYGAPSNGLNGVSLQWCAEPSPNPGHGCAQAQAAKLELASTRLQLSNFAYAQARIDFMNQANSSKPAF